MLHFRSVNREMWKEGWEISRPHLLPAMERGRVSEDYLLKEIRSGESVLIHIIDAEKVIGSLVFSIGFLEGRRVLRISLLGGRFQPGWNRYLSLFVESLASGADAKIIEFFTSHNVPHLTKWGGFHAIGTLYRKEV